MILSDQGHAPTFGNVALLVGKNAPRGLRRAEDFERVVKLGQCQVPLQLQHPLAQGVELLGGIADAFFQRFIGGFREGERVEASGFIVARSIF